MKKISLLVLAGIILMSAAAFAGGSNDNRVTIRVLYYLEASAPNAVADANKWFSDFEKLHPNVKIERENLFDDPYHDKLRAYSAAGQLPDVMYVWPSGRSDYLHIQRQLKDLTYYIQRDGLAQYYSPITFDPRQQLSGTITMFPQGVTSTHVFFTNMEVLNAVGLQPARTYTELVAQVPVLRAAGYQTVLIPAMSEWVMQSCLFSMVIGRFAGADWDTRIHNGTARFTDSDFVAAFDFIRRLYADGVISREALGVDYGDGPAMFASNRGAYYIDGDWRGGAFITDSGTGQALITPARQANIRVGVFPDIDLPGVKLNRSSSSVIGTGYAIRADIPVNSELERLSWELVKYLLGKEISARRLETGATPTPSRIDIDTAAIRLEPIQVGLGNLGNVAVNSTAVIDGVLASDVYEPINTGLIQLALGQQTAQQVATTVQAAYDTWRRANPR